MRKKRNSPRTAKSKSPDQSPSEPVKRESPYTRQELAPIAAILLAHDKNMSVAGAVARAREILDACEEPRDSAQPEDPATELMTPSRAVCYITGDSNETRCWKSFEEFRAKRTPPMGRLQDEELITSILEARHAPRDAGWIPRLDAERLQRQFQEWKRPPKKRRGKKQA